MNCSRYKPNPVHGHSDNYLPLLLARMLTPQFCSLFLKRFFLEDRLDCLRGLGSNLWGLKMPNPATFHFTALLADPRQQNANAVQFAAVLLPRLTDLPLKPQRGLTQTILFYCVSLMLHCLCEWAACLQCSYSRFLNSQLSNMEAGDLTQLL